VTAVSADPVEMTVWWQRMVPWWHAAYAAVLTITAAVALLTGAPRVVALPLVLLAVAYVTLAAPALRSDEQLRGAAYLGVRHA
jgi:uncharacterized membrane protein YphA (DoxX/SURF4 family)